MATVAHALVTTVRRRRHDLAVLRSIGFTRRDARIAIGWQSTLIAIVGLVLGVPLGIVTGRLVWKQLAESFPVVYVPPLALVGVLLIVPLAIAIANLVAAGPAHAGDPHPAGPGAAHGVARLRSRGGSSGAGATPGRRERPPPRSGRPVARADRRTPGPVTHPRPSDLSEPGRVFWATVGSGETSCCPGSGGDRKRCCRHQCVALFAELDSSGCVERCDVAASWAYPEREGLPPRFEGRVLDGDRERGFLDHVQPRFSEEFGEVTFAHAGALRLSFAVAIELVGRVPEEAEWSFAAGMIPDACGHDSFLAGYPGHLAQARDRVLHEVNDELRERGIEDPVLERELFGGRSSHVNRGIARLCRGDEGVGRIDGTDRGWS